MAGRLRSQAGNAVIELALILPVMMVLISGGIDVATAYARRTAVAAAARAGAEAAATVLAGQPLGGDEVPADVQDTVEQTVRAAAPDLEADITEVVVRWEGEPEAEAATSPQFALEADVPEVRNVTQIVDTRHDHRFWWWQPTLVPYENVTTYNNVPGFYTDRTPVIGPVTVSYPHTHRYDDMRNDAVLGAPYGQVYGATPWTFWVPGFLAIYGSFWHAAPSPVVMDWSRTFYSDNMFYANPTATGNAVLRVDDVGSTAQVGPFQVRDRGLRDAGLAQAWGNTGLRGATSCTPLSPPEFCRFDYAVRDPDQRMTFLASGNTLTRERRTLVVEVTYRYRPLSPFMRPLFGEGLLRTAQRVRVTSVY
jgi:hypothetical protein